MLRKGRGVTHRATRVAGSEHLHLYFYIMVIYNNTSSSSSDKKKPHDWIYGGFIRGPISLEQINIFASHGIGVLKLLLFIKYKEGLQSHGMAVNNASFHPNKNDPSWVRLGNNNLFFKNRQQKYRAIKRALSEGLIEEEMRTREYASAVVRLKKIKNQGTKT